MNLSNHNSLSLNSNRNHPLLNLAYIESIAKFFEPRDLVCYFSLCKDSKSLESSINPSSSEASLGSVVWGGFVNKNTPIYRQEYGAKNNFKHNPFVRKKQYFSFGVYDGMLDCFAKDGSGRDIPWPEIVGSEDIKEYILSHEEQELCAIFLMIFKFRIDSYHEIFNSIFRDTSDFKISLLHNKVENLSLNKLPSESDGTQAKKYLKKLQNKIKGPNQLTLIDAIELDNAEFKNN